MATERASDDLLFDALDAALSGVVRERSRAPRGDIVDVVLAEASKRQVELLAAEGLLALGALPADLELPRRRATGLARAILADEERRLCSAALARAGVEHAVLKGVLHDTLLYGGRGRRTASDLDLLVPPEREHDAMTALRAIGYERVLFKTHLATNDASKERLLVREAEDRSVHVDLHVGLINTPPFKDPSREVLARARIYETPHGPIRGLAPEDLVVHLAANLGGDTFRPRLPLAVDAAAILMQLDPDLDVVVRRAREWRATQATWALLALVDARFSVGVPAHLLRALRPRAPLDAWVARIAGIEGPPLRRPPRQAEAMFLIEWPLSGRALWPLQATARWARLRVVDRLRTRRGWDRSRS